MIARAGHCIRQAIAVGLLTVGVFTTACASASHPVRFDATDAYRNGYRDGYAVGRRDAHRRVWPNPQHARQFKSAHEGYDRRCACREEYEQNYRSGFIDGYGRAYDDSPQLPRARRE